MKLYHILPMALLVWNLGYFLVAAHDKRISRQSRRRRIPERAFVNGARFLGGLGVLVGFYLLRHKTQHQKLLRQVWWHTLLSYAFLAALLVLFWYLSPG